MRKVMLFVVLLLALVVAPVLAQYEPGTIADIVVAAATGETPEFSQLLALVQAADPAVLEALSDPEASLTVFAPTDAAFGALMAALPDMIGEEDLAMVMNDPEAFAAFVTPVLLYHALDGAVMSADVVAALEANDGAISVPTLNGQYIDIAVTEEGGVTIDQANLNLEMVDIEASNGVIHVIDAVLVPEMRTLAEIVVDAASDEEAPEFTTLLAAVQAADPAVLETLSDPEAELTVFAPTDAAFAAAVEALGEDAVMAIMADPAAVTPILLYHVVPMIAHSGDLATLMMEMEDMTQPLLVNTALEGTAIAITLDEEGNPFINASEDNPGAAVIATDIDAANGVIHVIDAVLLPPSGE
ncbi:MAG: fasciclin domain-containing protein [Chloroflexi bacterium]|nr:fasciclin domain-containing protein [Chloroflexota bacterium]